MLGERGILDDGHESHGDGDGDGDSNGDGDGDGDSTGGGRDPSTSPLHSHALYVFDGGEPVRVVGREESPLQIQKAWPTLDGPLKFVVRPHRR